MKNFSMFHSFVLALATWVLIGQAPTETRLIADVPNGVKS